MRFLTTIIAFSFFGAVLAQSDFNKTDSQGRKQGVWKKPYPQSTVFKYVGQFKDDKPVGKFTYYYESGTVQAIIVHRKDGKTSDASMYHNSGYLMAKGIYVNQEKDSTWVYYDDRGLVSYQEDYKLGKLHGQRVVYYEPDEGQYKVMEYAYWKDGKLDGEYKKYHPNMKLAEEGHYVNGERDGKVTHYHPNGKIARVENYKMGQRHGYFIVFDPKGIQAGYKLFWNNRELKGEALKKKEAELREKKQN